MNLQLDLRPTMDRLRDRVPALKLVGGAAEFAKAMQNTPAVPAAFVLPASASGGSNPFLNQLVEQEISSEFSVAIAVRNLADSSGAAALESLRPVRNAIGAALIGWSPDTVADAFGCEFAAGALTDFSPDGVLWWTDAYRTAHMIRSEP